MSLAFSNLPVSQSTISANPATFLDDLDAILDGLGWTSSTYLTGKVYACSSPQGLSVQVRIWDPADSNFADCVAFQWLMSASPNTAGLVHHLRLDAAYNMAVWANCCSLFIARVGVTHSSAYPWSVAGGVAWAPGLVAPTSQCAAQSPAPPDTTTELWWSTGSDTGAALFAAATLESFRSGYYCKRYSFCRNGVVTNVTAGTEAASLQLGIMRPTGYRDGVQSGFSDGMLFEDGTPMASDPLLSVDGVWYGQLWDACLLSAPMTLEATETIVETSPARTTYWINHTASNPNVLFATDDGRLYSLLLFTGAAGSAVIENIAY